MTALEQLTAATSRRYALNVQSKLLLGFTLLSALVSFLTARGMYTNLQGQVLEEFRARAQVVARLAAQGFDGDQLRQITSAQSEAYPALQQELRTLQGRVPEIDSVFILQKDAGGPYWVAVVGPRQTAQSATYGERYRDPSEAILQSFDSRAEIRTEADLRTASTGSVLAAYAPVFDSAGTQVGVIGVELPADNLVARQARILQQSILVFLFALFLGAVFGWVAGRGLTEPLVKLIEGARAFARGQFEQRIEIISGDEVEDLGRAFNDMAGEIRGLVTSLETRVAERTQDLQARSQELEAANRRAQRRATQFEALAQVTQSITSIRDLQELLPRITGVVSDRFGFYHVGIFLLDEISEYAVLIAANSPGGQVMLARRHRLRVGEEGIVGYAAATGKPRLALDVGQDATFFNNPDLPDTHSEVALPLISKNIIVGVLDVQSTETGAFTAEDVQMLSLLADQVSLAIENARLFDDTRKALLESEMMTRRSIRDAWSRLPEQQRLLGYRYNVSGATPLRQPLSSAPAEASQPAEEPSRTVVPIALRGEVIGELVVQAPVQSGWSADQLDLIKAVAERVALAAENARLFEETTARADRERLVSEITSKIRNNTDPQAMVQTALQELRAALGASRVDVIPQSNPAPGKAHDQGQVQP